MMHLRLRIEISELEELLGGLEPNGMIWAFRLRVRGVEGFASPFDGLLQIRLAYQAQRFQMFETSEDEPIHATAS